MKLIQLCVKQLHRQQIWMLKLKVCHYEHQGISEVADDEKKQDVAACKLPIMSGKVAEKARRKGQRIMSLSLDNICTLMTECLLVSSIKIRTPGCTVITFSLASLPCFLPCFPPSSPTPQSCSHANDPAVCPGRFS